MLQTTAFMEDNSEDSGELAEKKKKTKNFRMPYPVKISSINESKVKMFFK